MHRTNCYLRVVTPKGVADVSVLDWHRIKGGGVVGDLRWGAAPGASFRLVVTGDGRLVEWRATADAGGSLSARQLRAAPVGAMERALRAEVAGTGAALGQLTTLFRRLHDRGIPLDDIDLAEWSDFARSLSDFGERPRTGPAGRGDDSYAALSALYVGLIDEGEQRPIRAVADRLGLAEKTVQNHLFKARERGLLTSLGRGKAGGQLTNKAKEILSGNDQAP